MYSDKQLREVFHFLFLERLLKSASPQQYALNGGVNLRFFFASPRYSEDMDLDVFLGSVETLKKNAYKIMHDPSFLRVLRTFNIEQLLINDPQKAKHTPTTQRFKVRLQVSSGDEYPTKIEFSRRESFSSVIQSTIIPEITQAYRRQSFLCPHYSAQEAIVQKIQALAGRTEPQTRDPFDLYLLMTTQKYDSSIFLKVDKDKRDIACENLLNFTFSDYQGQVVEYLEEEHKILYGNPAYWQMMVDFLLGKLTNE